MPDKLNRLSLYIKKHCTPKKELKKLSLLRVECKLKIIKKVHLYKYTYRVQQTRNEKISTYSYIQNNNPLSTLKCPWNLLSDQGLFFSHIPQRILSNLDLSRGIVNFRNIPFKVNGRLSFVYTLKWRRTQIECNLNRIFRCAYRAGHTSGQGGARLLWKHWKTNSYEIID